MATVTLVLDDLGRLLHRGRRWVLGAWAVLVLLGATVGGSVYDVADAPDPLRAGAESARVQDRLEAVDPEGELVVAVFTGQDVYGVDVIDQATRVMHEVRELPDVVEVSDPWTTGAQHLVSPDRTGTTVVVEIDPTVDDRRALAAVERVDAKLRQVAMPEVLVGGPLLAEEAFAEQAITDAARGEGVAVLVLLVVLALALGGLVVGVLPVVTALGSVCVALLALAGLARLTSVSEYAVNVVTLLGLGLAVDYALLVLGRFREERAAASGRTDTAALLGRTLATSGRTVLVSGLTVGTALAGLLLLGDPVLSPMAVGGLVAVAAATLAGLTLAPALVAVGHARIPAPAPGRLLGGVPSAHALLPRLARIAQRRPWPVLVASTALLLLLATPLLSLDLRNSDVRSLPGDSEPRLAQEAIEREFPEQAATTITLLVDAPYDSQETADAMSSLMGIPGVADMMLLDPVPGDLSQILVEPEPDAAGDYDGPAGQDLVRRLRAADLGSDVLVGGPTAELVDTRDALADRAPWAILVVALLTALLLGRLTRSVVVPLKAVAMNLLSLGATLGVVVAVFQWGWGVVAARLRPVGRPRRHHPPAALHVRVRPLDGLPRLPRRPDPRGVGRGPRRRPGRRDRPDEEEATACDGRRPAGAQRPGGDDRHHGVGSGRDARGGGDRDRVPRLRRGRARRGEGDRRRDDRRRAARRHRRTRPAPARLDDAARAVELVATGSGPGARVLGVGGPGARGSSSVATGSSP